MSYYLVKEVHNVSLIDTKEDKIYFYIQQDRLVDAFKSLDISGLSFATKQHIFNCPKIAITEEEFDFICQNYKIFI